MKGKKEDDRRTRSISLIILNYGTLLKPVKKVIHGIEDDLNVMMIK